MRFTKEMFDAMGGEEGLLSMTLCICFPLITKCYDADAYYYQQFKKTLATAFLIVRRQATPLLSFMRTLLASGISDLSDCASVEAAIQGTVLVIACLNESYQII